MSRAAARRAGARAAGASGDGDSYRLPRVWTQLESSESSRKSRRRKPLQHNDLQRRRRNPLQRKDLRRTQVDR